MIVPRRQAKSYRASTSDVGHRVSSATIASCLRGGTSGTGAIISRPVARPGEPKCAVTGLASTSSGLATSVSWSRHSPSQLRTPGPSRCTSHVDRDRLQPVCPSPRASRRRKMTNGYSAPVLVTRRLLPVFLRWCAAAKCHNRSDLCRSSAPFMSQQALRQRPTLSLFLLILRCVRIRADHGWRAGLERGEAPGR